jgi:excinuclease ABC subunit C
VRESINILQRLFQLRQCEDTYFKNRSRPCLQHQIGRCSAPCVALVAPDTYADDVRHAVMFLDGRNDAILEEFKTAMEQSAEKLEFERAAKYRDQIKQLRKIQEQQYVHAASGDADVRGGARPGRRACRACSSVAADCSVTAPGSRATNSRSKARNCSMRSSQYYFGGGEREIPKAIVLAIRSTMRS